MHSLRNSPPDCFSQMLTHLEPRVSCTACNSLGSKPPPYHGPMWASDPTFSVFTNPKILFIPIIIYHRTKYKNGGAVVALRFRRWYLDLFRRRCSRGCFLSGDLLFRHFDFAELGQVCPVCLGGCRRLAAGRTIAAATTAATATVVALPITAGVGHAAFRLRHAVRFGL